MQDSYKIMSNQHLFLQLQATVIRSFVRFVSSEMPQPDDLTKCFGFNLGRKFDTLEMCRGGLNGYD